VILKFLAWFGYLQRTWVIQKLVKKEKQQNKNLQQNPTKLLREMSMRSMSGMLRKVAPKNDNLLKK